VIFDFPLTSQTRTPLPKAQDDKSDRIKRLAALFPGLDESQLGWLEEIAQQLKRPHTYKRNNSSDFISDCLLKEIGDGIRLHHCFSKEAFSKDKFEYLMERAANLCGGKAELAPKGNPGHDITINGVRFSLKTQADKGIKRGSVHISKFMELGRGAWTNRDEDLIGLRERFFNHMKSYDRILVLRRLSRDPQNWEYELIEIPKTLLERAKDGRLEITHASKQMPKPGNCYVIDEKGKQMFALYFDGGTERKLQIKSIAVANCIVHAQWRFSSEELVPES
jgi:Type II site-specific deoxyribonuclease